MYSFISFPKLFINNLYPYVLLISLVVLVAVCSIILSNRLGFPSLFLFLLIGILCGEDGLGFKFNNANLTNVIGNLLLALILFEGGLTTSWKNVRRVLKHAISLSIIGVLLSVALISTIVYYIFDKPLSLGLLLGSIVSSTDIAAIFVLLRRINIPVKLMSILELESGFNDAPTVILVTSLSEYLSKVNGDIQMSWSFILYLVNNIILEMSIGTIIGVCIGYLGYLLLSRISVSLSGLYSIIVVSIAMLSYGLAGVLHGSGFIAIYLTSVIIGNSKNIAYKEITKNFAESLGILSQIALFIMLGLLVTPHNLLSTHVVNFSLILGVIIVLIVRPISVYASTYFFAISWKEQLLISIAGLRGAVPIVLATVPFMYKLDSREFIFNVVFVLVSLYLLIQAPLVNKICKNVYG